MAPEKTGVTEAVTWTRLEAGDPEMALFEAQSPACGGDDMPVVTLLHGFTGTHEEWTPIASELSRFARVLAFDLPGHGASVASEHSAVWSLPGAAAVLDDALASNDIERCVLVGYSLGGRLALHVALERSTRIGGLVLESASPGIAGDEERRARRDADERLVEILETQGVEAFLRHWEKVPVIEVYERLLPGAERARLRRARLTCSPAGLAQSLRGMGTGSQGWLGGRLDTIEAPVGVITGALDEKFTTIGRMMVVGADPDRAIGGIGTGKWGGRPLQRGRLTVVPGAGHNVHITHPREFVTAVRAIVLGDPDATFATVLDGTGATGKPVRARGEHSC